MIFKKIVFSQARLLIKVIMPKSSVKSSTEGTSSKKLKVGHSNDIEENNASIIKEIEEARKLCADSIQDFKFNKKRVRVLSKATDIESWSEGVLYWMSRDQRVQDNWAFLYAQHLALKVDSPLHVCFCLVPKFLNATSRHYRFILKGLREVSEECAALNIQFHILLGEAKNVLPSFIKKHKFGGLVTDFAPLRIPMQWVEELKTNLPSNIAFCQVDAHNIVPCWVTSEKQEYAARTIRNKIHNKLKEFLTDFPPVIKHKFSSNWKAETINWSKLEGSIDVEDSPDVEWSKPGTKFGLMTLNDFCQNRLKDFGSLRNDPTKQALSNLSPWIHFGQIAVQRCILKVSKYKSKYPASVDAYIEEAIIRRELADNFCFYNPNYDKIQGAYDWAQATLKSHAKDKREYIYTLKQFEDSLTHDPLWNAAQRQMVIEGKMHGFLRMYWAKKILEWTKTPEEALEFAIYLNDKYELDGRDPNGYVGCMWSICGIHDQGWREREVFGKIRFMNYQGCKRKFDVDAFIAKYKKK